MEAHERTLRKMPSFEKGLVWVSMLVLWDGPGLALSSSPSPEHGFVLSLYMKFFISEITNQALQLPKL